MSRTNQAREPVPSAAGHETDGRRRRGTTSRARIVEALLELVREGNPSPGAAQVARLAGVGLRTVFRHFEDMDSLYREMGETIQAHVLPAVFRPYSATGWRERLEELLDRRVEAYEFIMPFKVSGELRRFQSAYIARDAEQHLELEKTSLLAVLPREVVDDPALLNALLALSGFQAWRVLRQDLKLDVAAARAAMRRGIDAMLGSAAGAAAREERGPTK